MMRNHPTGGGKQRRPIWKRRPLIELLEERRMLSAATVDVGPVFQAVQPEWSAWSGSGNSTSATLPLGASSPAATLSGSALVWVDYSNTKITNSALQLVYRDGVYQAGNLTLSLGGLTPGRTYTISLSSVDLNNAGSAASPYGATFDVKITDATRTASTALASQHVASMYSISGATLAPVSFVPKADGSAVVLLSRVGTTGNVWLNGFKLDDGVAVNDTTAPTAPSWQTSPYAVREGVAGATMIANDSTDTAGVQYYFENITVPTRNSGWISSPSWYDLGLTAGQTYQYHFKVRDRSANGNQTAWSTTQSVTTYVDNTFAGFTPAETGPRTGTFDFTGLKPFAHVPAVGVHPRIYTSPAELPDIRANAANTQAGREAMAQVDAQVRLLRVGNSGYNRSAPYALDTAGSARLGNVGYNDSSTFYNALLNYDWNASPLAASPLPFNSDGTADTKRRDILASQLALAAYQSWVYQGQTEYDQLARDVAKVMDTWARLVINDAALTPSNYNVFGGSDMGEAYDFAFNAMTTSQRNNVRAALAKILLPASGQYGYNVDPTSVTSNWAVINDFVPVTMMAIEGEPGYDAGAFRQYMKTQFNFLNYGWYKSGAPFEGEGKNYLYVDTMNAFARRDYGLIGHKTVKTFVSDYMARMMMPFGKTFMEYDDWGGTGSSSSSIGDWKPNVMDMIGAKYTWPTDPNIDFVYQNYFRGTGNDYKTFVDLAPSGYFNPLLLGSLQATDISTPIVEPGTPAFTAAASAANRNQLTFNETERGLVITRSGFDSDALQLNTQTRQDLGGHTHADRNNFVLSGLGRLWSAYRSESGGTTGTIGESRYHSVPLIDDIGQGIDGAIQRTPGRIDDVSDTSAATFIAGDAKNSYDWVYKSTQNLSRSALLPGTYYVEESLNDFRLVKSPDAFYDTPLFDRPFWNGPGTSGFYKVPFNPVQRAFRTSALVRGTRSYALIMDDLQKDNATHDYKWQMQLPDDLSVDSSVVSLDPNNYRNDLIIKEAGGNRKLLVRVVYANGLVSKSGAPAYIDNYVTPRDATKSWNRLIVEANAVSPDFKIMLFPFTDGQTLPVTTVANGRFTNTLDGRVDTVDFSLAPDGRTRFKLTQAGVQTGGSTSDPVVPAAPTSLVAAVVSQTRIDLTWVDNATNTKTFSIERSTDGTNFSQINTTPSGVTAYSDVSASAGTTYWYRVMAVSDLASAPSVAVRAATAPAGTIVVRPGQQVYTQTFDSLQYGLVQNVNWGGDTWLPGWSLARNDTLQFRTDSGQESYPRPFGQGVNGGTDRALGGLPQGNGYQAQGALFRNDLGQTISGVDVSYNLEQWRANVNGGSIKFYYKLQSASTAFDLASTTGWTTLSSLDFNARTATVATTLDGTAAANRAARSTRLNVSIPANQYLWLGWRIVGGNNNNNPSMSIDDLSVHFDTPPIIATVASATAGSTPAAKQLDVLGNDDGGESSLTYTWSVLNTPPGSVSFSANGTNAAKKAIATFGASGTYDLRVTVRDPAGQTVTSDVSVGVDRTAPVLASAASRKTHGAAGVFDLNLPLTGTPAVEPRNGGVTLLVFTFNEPVVPGAAFSIVTSGGSGSLSSYSGNQMFIALGGVPNARTLSVTLNNVSDASGNLSTAIVQARVLFGDVSGSGAVNSTDIAIVKSRSGVLVNATTFLSDLNCNGLLNSTDIALVKSQSGSSVLA